MIPRTPIYTLLACVVCFGLVVANMRGSRLISSPFSPRANSSFFGPQHK